MALAVATVGAVLHCAAYRGGAGVGVLGGKKLRKAMGRLRALEGYALEAAMGSSRYVTVSRPVHRPWSRGDVTDVLVCCGVSIAQAAGLHRAVLVEFEGQVGGAADTKSRLRPDLVACSELCVWCGVVVQVVWDKEAEGVWAAVVARAEAGRHG
jgi:hypothetical protein